MACGILIVSVKKPDIDDLICIFSAFETLRCNILLLSYLIESRFKISGSLR